MPNVASSIKEHSLLFNTFQSSWSSEVDKDTYHMFKDRYMNVRRLNNELSPNMNHTNRKSFKWKKSYWTTTIAYQLPQSELTLQALYVCETLVLFSCSESILYKSILIQFQLVCRQILKMKKLAYPKNGQAFRII